MFKLPYIDGIPDNDQESIRWIKNNDILTGASKNHTNDGILNSVSLMLYKNIVYLANTGNELVGTVNTQGEQLAEIKETIDAINTEHGIIYQIAELTNTTNELTISVNQHSSVISDNSSSILAIKDAIGEPVASDSSKLPILSDLYYVKTVVGSRKGFDVNGNPNDSETGTGIIYQLEQTQLDLNKIKTDLTSTNKLISELGVEEITTNIEAIRGELGVKPADSLPVYTHLNTIDSSVASNTDSITEIKDKIGFDGNVSISSRVDSLVVDIKKVDTRVDTVSASVNENTSVIGDEDSPGSIKNTLHVHDEKIVYMSDVLGESEFDGLQKNVHDLESAVGSSSKPNTLVSDVITLKDANTENTAKIRELENVVGTKPETFVGTVIDNVSKLNKSMYGDVSASPSTVEYIGISEQCKVNARNIGTSTSGSETGIYKLIADLTKRIDEQQAEIDALKTKS